MYIMSIVYVLYIFDNEKPPITKISGFLIRIIFIQTATHSLKRFEV